MRNPKTIPNSPPPVPVNGWVRKNELDDFRDLHLPIPTQVVSNEEYYPLPQTREQKAVEHHLLEIAGRNAKRLGMPRRRFLSSACGMAVAFAAMNRVFGQYFRVEAAEMMEPQAGAAARDDYFIFDVQTHHVAAGRQRAAGIDFLDSRIEGRQYNPALRERDPVPEDLNVKNYIKEGHGFSGRADSIRESAWRSSAAADSTCLRRSGRSWRRDTVSRQDSPSRSRSRRKD